LNSSTEKAIQTQTNEMKQTKQSEGEVTPLQSEELLNESKIARHRMLKSSFSNIPIKSDSPTQKRVSQQKSKSKKYSNTNEKSKKTIDSNAETEKDVQTSDSNTNISKEKNDMKDNTEKNESQNKSNFGTNKIIQKKIISLHCCLLFCVYYLFFFSVCLF
jgi:hypothetical protein